jgi:ferrous iron transport protein B
VGLTSQSYGIWTARARFNLPVGNPGQYIVALAGNPNTGKSTVFNALTGLRQHTGNWPGKTVLQARGSYTCKGRVFNLVDLPGTYSLLANSADEQVARDFLCLARPDVTIVVADATCLERNLNLTLQVTEITPNVVLCVNLIDEARRKDITVDFAALSRELGVPVVPTAASLGEGLKQLQKAVFDVALGKRVISPKKIVYHSEIEEAISMLEPQLQELLGDRINHRWVSLRILEGDQSMLQSIADYLGHTPGQSLPLSEVPA